MERKNGGSLAQRTTDTLPGAAATAERAAWNGPAPAILAHAFSMANGALRVRVLGRLLGSVGSLALAVIGGGAFFKFLSQARSVSVEDAARVTTGQVFELASYVQQSNPGAVEQVLALLSQDTPTMTALGASVAAIVINRLSRPKTNPR